MSEQLAELKKKGGGDSSNIKKIYFGGRTIYGQSGGIGALIPSGAVKMDEIKGFTKVKIQAEHLASGISVVKVKLYATNDFTQQYAGTDVSFNTNINIASYISTGKTYLEIFVETSNTNTSPATYMLSATFS